MFILGSAFLGLGMAFAQESVTLSDLIISEYVEGSSYNKAIEIYNGTGADVDLSAYTLQTQRNGSGEYGSALALEGTLANGLTYVIVNSECTNSDLTDAADLLTGSQAMNFNGNDPVALFKGETKIDEVGVFGSAENWGAEVTLRRIYGTGPSATYNAEEWTEADRDDFSDVGSYGADIEAPSIRMVTGEASDPNTIMAHFTETLDSLSAITVSNYTLDNGATIDSAIYQSGWEYVVLKTSALTAGTEYTLTINGVTDAAGNAIDIANGSIKTVDVEYGISNSPTVAPTSWSTNSPQWQAGKYIWQRTKTTTPEGVSSYSKAVCIQGAKGQDGINGTNGKDGVNGTSSYFHVAYANSADGSKDFSTTVSANKQYIGTYVDNTPNDSDDHNKYSWTLIKGLDGKNGIDGKNGVDGKTYYFDGERYWRACVFVEGSVTLDAVTPESSYLVGLKFGEFEAMLSDLPCHLEETIPDFHNMEFRMKQLRDAVEADVAGRMDKVRELVAEIEKDAYEMCCAERYYREGKLPKRICHCDTKVSNMLFDKEGNVLCIIDLDTVMSSFVFSDFGDFLRSAANTGQEDDKNLDNVKFNFEIFKSFAKGYIESAKCFLTPLEIELLPYAVTLFPYMQAVRFLTDYINGDTYYQIKYPEHNYVRTLAQYKLYKETVAAIDDMREYIKTLI